MYIYIYIYVYIYIYIYIYIYTHICAAGGPAATEAPSLKRAASLAASMALSISK